MLTITICEETVSGKILERHQIDVSEERTCARELIRSHVYQQVQDYNQRQQAGATLDDDRNRVEATLNGPRTSRQADWKHQFERAISAFQSGQILLIVDDRQQHELDEEIWVTAESRISFLRLTPLAGG